MIFAAKLRYTTTEIEPESIAVIGCPLVLKFSACTLITVFNSAYKFIAHAKDLRADRNVTLPLRRLLFPVQTALVPSLLLSVAYANGVVIVAVMVCCPCIRYLYHLWEWAVKRQATIPGCLFVLRLNCTLSLSYCKHDISLDNCIS